MSNPAKAFDSTIDFEPEDEEFDLADYLFKKSDWYRANPPAAPEGFKLLDCDAEPRHWPTYDIDDSDYYPGPCPMCIQDNDKARMDDLLRRTHWARHWFRGRKGGKVVRLLHRVGLVKRYRWQMSSICDCYVVTWKWQKEGEPWW